MRNIKYDIKFLVEGIYTNNKKDIKSKKKNFPRKNIKPT